MRIMSDSVNHPTEFTLELPHLRLAAKAWGDPGHAPVLALHGWLDNAGTFDHMAPWLRNCYLVALDLPGHGLSDHRPLSAWYHYIDYLDEVVAAVDALGWGKFSLLGHSLGGVIASAFAAVCPERVQRLMLIEALGPLTRRAEETLEQLKRAFFQRAQISSKELRLFPNVEAAITARMQANGLSRPAATALVARGLKAMPGGYSWSSDPRLTLALPMFYSEEQAMVLLGGIRAPTLLVLSEPYASFIAWEQMEKRITQVADIQLIRLPGNHHLHLEHPDSVAAVCNAFLATNIAP